MCWSHLGVKGFRVKVKGLARKFIAVRDDKYNLSWKAEQKLHNHIKFKKKITRNYLILLKAVSIIVTLTVNIEYDLISISMWVTADLQAHKVRQIHSFLAADPTILDLIHNKYYYHQLVLSISNWPNLTYNSNKTDTCSLRNL